MSQEKVDRYKQEKYNRKHAAKKKNVKKVLTYIAVTLVAIAFVIYLGYSVAVSTGLYTPPTQPATMSQQEIESLRQTLIDNNDPYVQVETTTAAPVTEAATTPATEQASVEASSDTAK